MADPLQDRFDVEVDGATYTFKVPTIKYEIEVAYKAAEVRRKSYPEERGALGTLDYQTVQFSRYGAMLELYLIRATTLWPYGFTDDDMSKVDFNTPPKVDFENFPANRTQSLYAVGAAFEAEVSRFQR